MSFQLSRLKSCDDWTRLPINKGILSKKQLHFKLLLSNINFRVYMFVNHIHIGMQRPGSNLAILFLCFKHTPFNSLQYTGAFGNCIHADKRLSETDSLITLVLTIFYFGNPNSASLGYFLLNIRHSVNRIDRKYYELLKSNIDFEGAHGNWNTEQKRQKSPKLMTILIVDCFI